LHVFDMWRGEARPEALNGDDIPVGARIARLTGIAVLFESIGGGTSPSKLFDVAQAACSTRALWPDSRATRPSGSPTSP
jgi:response regulator RpfG family c-di-GMP phosphodiesterase